MKTQEVVDLLNKLPSQVHVNMMSKIKDGIFLYYACECLDCKMPFVFTSSESHVSSQTTGSGKRAPAIPTIHLECQRCKSPKRMSITPIIQEHFDALNKTKP